MNQKNMSEQQIILKAKLYILTLAIIFLTDSLLFGTNSNRLFLHGQRYIVILITIVMLINFLKDNNKVQIIMIFLSISIIISMLLSGRLINGFFYYTVIALIWFAYLFSFKYPLEDFSYCYCRIMRIIAIISLIGWIFSDFICTLDWVPIISNTSDNPFKSLLITNIPLDPNNRQRNMGPFWEPGAYQIYLSVALYFSLFIEKHKGRFFDCALFLITALTTFSGATLIPLLLFLLAYAIEKRNFRSFLTIMLLSIMVVILLKTENFDLLFDKMSLDKENHSLIYRWIGIEGAFKGFLRNPFFGSTPEVNMSIKSNLAQEYIGGTYGSNANTFMNYFGYFGFFVGSFMLVHAYRFFKYIVKSKIALFLCFAAFIFSTSNENLVSSIFLVTLMFLHPSRTIEKRKFEENENVMCYKKSYAK